MTTNRYAANTDVTADRSRGEIERILARYGASSFMYGWDAGRAVLAFTADGRQVRFVLPMPDRHDQAFTLTDTGRERSGTAADKAYDQAIRQSWRALALVVKAKLEAVAAGIVTFDEEFLAHFVLPGGGTVAEHVIPRVEEAYETGQLGELLPPPRPALEVSTP